MTEKVSRLTRLPPTVDPVEFGKLRMATYQDFVSSFFVEPEGPRAGEQISLFPHQTEWVSKFFALRPDGRVRHKVNILSVGRGGGKSTLMSSIALSELMFPAPWSPKPWIILGSGSADQADMLMEKVLASVYESEALKERLRYRMRERTLTNEETGGRIEVITADGDRQEGKGATLYIGDEPHAWPHTKAHRLDTAVRKGMIKNPQAQIIYISTVGLYRHRFWGKLWEIGQRDDPPEDLNYMHFGLGDEPAPDNLRDEKLWARCIPTFPIMPTPQELHDILTEDEERGDPQAFITWMLNGWGEAVTTYWLKREKWLETATTDDLKKGDTITVGVDYAYKNDSVAVVACRHSDMLIRPLKVWEREKKDERSTAPIVEDDELIAFLLNLDQVFDVVTFAADPNRFGHGIRLLDKHGIDVEVANTSGSFNAAYVELERAVYAKRVRHNDPTGALTRHIENTGKEFRSDGSYKLGRAAGKGQKIDASVAMTIAWYYSNLPTETVDDPYALGALPLI